MLCLRCQRHLRNCEGVKCGQCESRYHSRCVSDGPKDHRNAGDRGYQWKCALCQNSETKIQIDKIPTREEAILKAIYAINEKIELVNKIQLPKLSNELLQLKSITDDIIKGNEEILRKIEEYNKNKNGDCEDRKEKRSETSRRRKRNWGLSPNCYNSIEENEDTPILPVAEKSARYRPRKRSYLLHKMFLLLNRKLRSTTKPRKRK